MSYSPGTRQMIAWTKLGLCNHRPSYLGSNVIGNFASKTWKLEIQLGLSWSFQRMLYYPDQVPHRFRCPQGTADTLKNLFLERREKGSGQSWTLGALMLIGIRSVEVSERQVPGPWLNTQIQSISLHSQFKLFSLYLSFSLKFLSPHPRS